MPKPAKSTKKGVAPSSTESPLTKYKIQLCNVSLICCHYTADVKGLARTPPRQYGLQASCKRIADDPTTLTVYSEITLRVPADTGKLVDVRLGYDVDFTHTKDMPEELKDYFTHVNAPFLIWAYFREAVVSLTTRSALPPLYLPTLDARQIRELFGSAPKGGKGQ